MLYILLLQFSIIDILNYSSQESEREIVKNVEIRKISQLEKNGIFQPAHLVACDNNTFLIYDSGKRMIFIYQDDNWIAINSGFGGGPLDIMVARGFSCNNSSIAYYDTELKRITVYDRLLNKIMYQSIISSNIDQLYLYGDRLFYFNIHSILNQPLQWLNKIHLKNSLSEVILTINSDELGKGFMLTGRTSGNADTFCHMTVFSGLIACFSAKSQTLLFATSPINKQGFIEIKDRSGMFGLPAGSAIGKSPEDEIINADIGITNNNIFLLPIINSKLGIMVDVYKLSNGTYVESYSVEGYRIGRIAGKNDRLYGIAFRMKDEKFYLVEIIY